jgi:hypothetical protein
MVNQEFQHVASMPYPWPTFGPLVGRMWAGMSSKQQGPGREDAGSRSSSLLWGVPFDGDYYGSGSGIQTTSNGVCTSSDAWLREGCTARRWLPSIHNNDKEKFVFTCCVVQRLSSAFAGPQLILDLKNRTTSHVITTDHHFDVSGARSVLISCLYNIDLNWMFTLQFRLLNLDIASSFLYPNVKCTCYFAHVCYMLKLNSMALIRERTTPTERPPPVGEVSANFCG